ncbi:MAG TPA: fatty acid desaturase [Steroidobacteraceae bacterium]|nr:fatty acid desaturase [Steroidobacteraceae bacterium]
MSDPTGRPTIPNPQRPAFEIPTLLLLASVYGGWLAITFFFFRIPLALSIPLTVLMITLHSSLQHEMTHGHPTRWRKLNRLLAMPPLALWMPFDRYLHTHHAHHIDARLTDPVDDPETYYWAPEHWARLSPVTRGILRIEQTLAGRITVGAFWRIWLFWCGELRAFVRGVPGVRRSWLEHLALCIPIVLWVKLVCGIPVWLYFVAMVVPANAIQLIRSFAEHRAHPDVPARIAIVERSWILGPLFLFNNLHSLHHESPGIPWYQCPARYRAARERLIARNGGLVYSTYFEVARRFLFRAHDVLPHPMGGIPSRIS